jgi:hypothetical protein
MPSERHMLFLFALLGVGAVVAAVWKLAQCLGVLP